MTDSATALANRVAELVREHWDEHGDPLLLSQLGSADHGAVGRSAKEISLTLAGFLRDHVADQVRVISGSAHPLVMAALPFDIDQHVDVDNLLAQTRERSAAHGQRFHPAFWAAFRVPLDERSRRFLSTRAPFRFEDTTATEYDRAGYVEVERQHIADAESDAGDVQRRISDWLAARGLNSETFLAVNSAGFDLPPNDLLGRLLVALEPDELRRMSIPLDIVSKLRRQPLS